jgi:hypothetical protein
LVSKILERSSSDHLVSRDLIINACSSLDVQELHCHPALRINIFPKIAKAPN